MYARVTAYKGFLLCELLVDKSIEGGVATSLDRPGNLGQVIMDTGKNLGISAEALELLKTIKKSHDAIGDVDWWACDDKSAAFSWLGPIKRAIYAKNAEGSRDYRADLAHVVIANEVPPDAIVAIDKLGPPPEEAEA